MGRGDHEGDRCCFPPRTSQASQAFARERYVSDLLLDYKTDTEAEKTAMIVSRAQEDSLSGRDSKLSLSPTRYERTSWQAVYPPASREAQLHSETRNSVDKREGLQCASSREGEAVWWNDQCLAGQNRFCSKFVEMCEREPWMTSLRR